MLRAIHELHRLYRICQNPANVLNHFCSHFLIAIHFAIRIPEHLFHLDIKTPTRMKKQFIAIFFLAFLLFGAGVAKAQLTFYNGTACDVKLFGSFTYSNNPCQQGPYCTTGTILAPAMSTVVLPGGPCLSPVPPVTANFIRVGVYTQTGLFLGVSFCGTQTQNYVDCTGTPRTLQIFSPNFAAIY